MVEVDFAAARMEGVDHPRVDVDQLAEFFRHFIVGGQVIALAADGPAGVHGRQQRLLVDVFQDRGNAGRQVVVQQNRARIEIFQAQAATVA